MRLNQQGLLISGLLCFWLTAGSADSEISITGAVLMLDAATPHVKLVVQAVRLPAPGAVAATTLTDSRGDYRFSDLPPGEYQVRCYTTSGYVYFNDGAPVAIKPNAPTPQQADFFLPPFKKGTWRTYDTLNGLLNNDVHAIGVTPEGLLWLATYSGVCFYDGNRFIAFSEEDGLSQKFSTVAQTASDGVVWFGTKEGVVISYDGHKFTHHSIYENAQEPGVTALYSDPKGLLWVGAESGLYQYSLSTQGQTPAPRRDASRSARTGGVLRNAPTSPNPAG